MMRGTRIRVTAVLAAVGVSLAIALTVNSLAAAGDEHSLTAVAAAATARFHDLDAAKAAGWNVLVADKDGITCIDNQPVGGMGVHYANGKLLGDGVVDPAQPEALVYAPNADGQPELAALEYIVFAGAWTAAGHSDPPQLYGQTFTLTPAGNRFGLDPFWSLHVWIWQPNSAGLFQPWNPRVHCG
jgi:hypothetical protein